MNYRSVTWRALLVLAAFVGVGLWTNALVVHHAASRNTPIAQVHLAAMMAGLFAGGAAALLTILTLALARRK